MSEMDFTFAGATLADLVSHLFKNDYGQPFKLTIGQQEIFNAIYTKGDSVGKNRLHVMTYTQYGKSDTVAMAVLLRAATFAEKWAIVAPSQPKARIIMGYIIKHLFESEYTLSRFKIKEGESIEAIRRERSKNRLTFRVDDGGVGEIFILSAESKLKSEDVGNSLMGFGAPNLVMDEAALISDESDAKAMRMVGGFTDEKLDFVVKIGNPFKRNHFLAAFEDDRYHKINVDWQRGVREGRLAETFVQEMKPKPFFGVLYANEFPRADEIDAKGWTQLIGEDDIARATMQEGEDIKHAGERRIGNDIARGGGNDTTWILRSMNFSEVVSTSQSDNLNDTASRGLMYMKEFNVVSDNFFVDAIGVGGGVVDMMHAQQKKVRGINVGERAIEEARYTNKRAEAYWRLREWLKRGGRLSNDERWYQICQIKYKPDTRGRIRIMSKDEMRAMGFDSPDVADGLMLTFIRSEHRDVEEFRKKRKKKRKMMYNKGVRVRMGGY